MLCAALVFEKIKCLANISTFSKIRDIYELCYFLVKDIPRINLFRISL